MRAAAQAAASLGDAIRASGVRCRSFSSGQQRSTSTRTHLIFGANTDVGKTLISAGLVRSALLQSEHRYKEEIVTQDNNTNTNHNSSSSSSAKNSSTNISCLVNYTKPLQCGGSDENFVRKVVGPLFHNNRRHHWHFEAHTLFDWDTPSSPHYAARLENKPVSDHEIIQAVTQNISIFQLRCLKENNANGVHYIESAGGVMSPASSSPDNHQAHHAHQRRTHAKQPKLGNHKEWGWSTQADLYTAIHNKSSSSPNSASANASPVVILVGDGKLGGISCTLTALEALVCRGYKVGAIVFLRNEGQDTEQGYVNVEASQEYLQTR
jgi:dethiobiotin synthetase/adenosylmethionine--8-amino-7-oxononanoate aminotransferase